MIKKEKIGLAFAQRTGSTTRGTRFVLRLAVLVLMLTVRYQFSCSRYVLWASACGTNLLSRGTGLQASSRRCSRTLSDYYAAQIKQTKHP